MAFKFSKDQSLRIDALVAALDKAAGDLEDAVDFANEAIEKAIAVYNEAGTALDQGLGEVAQSFTEQLEEKSEEWQESDKGQAVQEWISDLENFVSNELMTPDFEAIRLEYTEKGDIPEIAKQPDTE